MNVSVCMCLFVHLILVIRAHDEKFKILGQNSWQICKCSDIPSNFQASHNYSHVTSYNICGNKVRMMGHAILSVERLVANSCKASENVLCFAIIVSSAGNQLHEMLFVLLFVCGSIMFVFRVAPMWSVPIPAC